MAYILFNSLWTVERERVDCKLSKFYVRFSPNPKHPFKTPEERAKQVPLILGMFKADIHANVIKDFGMCMEGCSGYIIFEEDSETDLFANLSKWQPYVSFDVKQVQTIDEAITSMGITVPEAKDSASPKLQSSPSTLICE
jgi:hypothetical protein